MRTPKVANRFATGLHSTIFALTPCICTLSKLGNRRNKDASIAAKMGRVSREHARQYYAKRRLENLRTVCPDLPDNVLQRVRLQN